MNTKITYRVLICPVNFNHTANAIRELEKWLNNQLANGLELVTIRRFNSNDSSQSFGSDLYVFKQTTFECTPIESEYSKVI